jgi:hypothetical protein
MAIDLQELMNVKQRTSQHHNRIDWYCVLSTQG